MRSKLILALSIISAFALKAEVLESHVAKIGETGYETLAEAFNAATSDDTIVLLRDITLSSPITVSGQKTIALDGGGYTLTSTLSQYSYDKTENVESELAKSPENLSITMNEGGRLVIKGGVYNNVSFWACSTSEGDDSASTLCVEKGDFNDCQFISSNYKSKITIEDGDFDGGLLLVRSFRSCKNVGFADIEINGGMFNDLKATLYVYYFNSDDSFHINAGTFENCEISAEDGTFERNVMHLGNSDSNKHPAFLGCTIQANMYKSIYAYTPRLKIWSGSYSSCDISADETVSGSGNVKLAILGGVFDECQVAALRYDSTVTISDAVMTGGKILAIADLEQGGAEKTTLTIDSGIYKDVFIGAYELGYDSKLKFSITGGTFDYCGIAIYSGTPETSIIGGVYNGCLFASLSTRHWSGHTTTMNVRNITANGCHFLARNDIQKEGDTGSSPAITSLKITSGTYYGCTKEARSYASSGRQATVSSDVEIDRAVAQIGDVGYTTLGDAFAQLNKEGISGIDVYIIYSSYTPAVGTFLNNGTEKKDGWDWSLVRYSGYLTVPAGKTVTITGGENLVDSNFSVAGTLVLESGYYTGLFTKSGSGMVYAAAGCRFKNDPSGFIYLPGKLIEEDDNGDYVVRKRIGLGISIR